MGNEAVEINAPTGLSIHITDHGSDWYWAAFSVFALVGLFYIAGAYKMRPANERVFYFNSIASLFFMAITYFTLASNLGWVGIPVEFEHAGRGVRQIFYSRYVGWFLAFPPFLGNLAILAAVPWPTALFTVLAQEVFVVCLLIGTLIESTYKWGYFTFAVGGFFLVAFNLVFTFRKGALPLDKKPFNGFQFTAYGFVFLMVLYPICWGLSEGGNVIQPDSEAAFYGVLDVLLFVALNIGLHFFIKDLDFHAAGLTTTQDRALFHTEKGTSFDHNGGVAAAADENAAAAPSDAPAADQQRDAEQV